MALSALHLFLFSLSVLSVSSSARPCKSFFYTTTIQGSSPNFNILPFESYTSNSPNFITFFFSPINIPDDLPNHPSIFHSNFNPIDSFSLRRYPFPRLIINDEEETHDQERPFMPMRFQSTMPRNSVRNQVKDLISVVGAMLFGVGCGALTAAAMFLVWSCFYPDSFDMEDESDSDDFDDGDDDDVSSKKIRFVIIPDDDIVAIKKAAQAKAKAKAEIA